jgi:hypothetical protein
MGDGYGARMSSCRRFANVCKRREIYPDREGSYLSSRLLNWGFSW